MLFSSQAFCLLFLPVTLALYYRLADSRRWRVRLLLAASLVFYGWWDWRFVPLLVASVTLNWLVGRVSGPRLGPAVAIGVAINLALLGLVKYADFLAATALALVGAEHRPLGWILPLGISFFTFQQISWLVDRRRGMAPAYGLTDYAAYVTFFPQLIAGPIVRHDELLPQLGRHPLRAGWWERCGRGALLFVLGLVKKVWLADGLAQVVDPRFAAAADGVPAAHDAWLATAGYTLQLYFDFSAYSDMAIGLGLLFGLVLPTNFHHPYRAISIREFWRRWHMTLSRFLRDYVYIPLGGSRQGFGATAAAILVTMTLCGLWHGAGWTFVAWGVAHGLAIVLSRAWSRTGVLLPRALSWLLTLAFVMAGWVLFRAADFEVAGRMFAALAGLGGGPGLPAHGRDWALVAVGAAMALLGPSALELARRPWVVRRTVAAVAAVVLVAVLLRVGAGRSLEFIYFQF